MKNHLYRITFTKKKLSVTQRIANSSLTKKIAISNEYRYQLKRNPNEKRDTKRVSRLKKKTLSNVYSITNQSLHALSKKKNNLQRIIARGSSYIARVCVYTFQNGGRQRKTEINSADEK